jgi:mono/diheme cytochrome c family protein
MQWLSTGVPDGAKLIGAGTLQIKEPARAADPSHGAQIYAQTCAACHGPDGLGQRAKWGGLSVSAAQGSRQFQQRRRNEPPFDGCRLRHAQHADWSDLRRLRAN